MTNKKNETAAVLAGIGIGAALMYFLDPNRGNARRAQAADQTAGKIRSARREIEVTRRDLRNRAHGVAAEISNTFSHEPISDQQLAERVRAELGHRVDTVRGVDVSADGGTVVLSGAVADERDRAEILAAVRHVRGVESIDDRMS